MRRDDPRRSRALVGFVLARQARDGHTVTPASGWSSALREFGVADAGEAVAAALEAATVIEVGDAAVD